MLLHITGGPSLSLYSGCSEIYSDDKGKDTIMSKVKLNTQVKRSPRFVAKVREAAELHAKANSSDPFAYSRVVLHMFTGLEIPDDVKRQAERMLAGGHTRAEALVAMQQVRREEREELFSDAHHVIIEQKA